MKYSEFLRQNNLNEKTIRDFFRNNMKLGRAPVALYICPECDELMEHNMDSGYFCPVCKGEK